MRRNKAFTLIELLVVVGIIALLVAILMPNLVKVREMAKRMNCAANIKSMGSGYSVYVEDASNGSWPWYLGAKTGGWTRAPGLANHTLDSTEDINASDREHAVTELLYKLIREKAVNPKQFLCPSSTEVEEPDAFLENVDIKKNYYDFSPFVSDNRYVSYSYQAPVSTGTTATNAGWANGVMANLESAASQMAVISDKSPWQGLASNTRVEIDWNDTAITVQQRKDGISPNHGGDTMAILFVDYHVESGIAAANIGLHKGNIFTASDSNVMSADDPINSPESSLGSADGTLLKHKSYYDSFLIGPLFGGQD